MAISDLTATSYKEFWRRNGSRKGGKSTAQNLVWVKKEIGWFVAHTTRKSNIDGIWYFDSGCSRHMTRCIEFLTNLHKENGGQVTFGDGAKGYVVGKGDLNDQGLPKLKNVLLVDGLKANLISISQLCDQNLYVKFTKDGCQLMTEKGVTVGRVVQIRSDHEKEFENHDFANFCESKGISHEFSAPKTLQQNGIVEIKNRTLQEMARTMINTKELPHKLWAKAVNTASYVSNHVHLRYLTRKTPYKLWKGRKHKVHYFHEFGSRCHVLRNVNN
ncbi:hypothetical protein H6P81_006032 [Aristolochia fimbriata]|uniref:Integrase catalytic domain-containing protein n=1 Tax=Aristolochia fimbriata TaxID=158543 RepID=A0AAV7EWD7_ARIFI|nr:hypothetical protein H6P81_006032 [Aristolochia fimbriata]